METENTHDTQQLKLSAVSTKENAGKEREEFQGKMNCCINTDEFLNANKLIPDTDNHKRSSDSPICEYHASDEGEA
jgi:hypothetical protein